MTSPAETHRSPWLRAGLLALVGAGGAIAGACTAALDFTECRQDADCSKFFTEDDMPMRCEDAQCVARERCDGNSQCAGLGEGYVCTISGKCVEVVSDNCAAPIYPDGEPSDDVVLIGSIVAKSGPDAALGEAAERAIIQAVEDFNAGTKLQNGQAIALVACDSKGSVTQAKAAAEHLGKDLATPAIIGPLDEDELARVAKDVSVANGVRAFTNSPTAIDDLDFADMDLVWMTNIAAAYQGRAIGQHITFEQVDGVFENPSVVFLFSLDEYGYGMYAALASEPQDNGPNRIPEVNGQQIASYANVDAAKGLLDNYIAGTPPDLLIFAGGPEVAELVDYYAASGKPWPTRVYVGQRAAAAVAALDIPELAPVLRAIGPELETDNLAAVRERIGGDAGPPEVGLAYDATMATLLAMAGIPDGTPIAGPTIAKQMSRLRDPGGVAVSFGDAPSSFIPAASNALSGGMTIDITGASGPLSYVDGGTMCGNLASYAIGDDGALEVVARFTTECPDATGTWATVEP